jgi:hypothetical protein
VKMYAVVTIDRAEPDQPRLYEAYPADAVGDNPIAADSPARSGLAAALHEPDILTATIVAIDLDDEALLAALRRDTPTIGGIVTG